MWKQIGNRILNLIKESKVNSNFVLIILFIVIDLNLSKFIYLLDFTNLTIYFLFLINFYVLENPSIR